VVGIGVGPRLEIGMTGGGQGPGRPGLDCSCIAGGIRSLPQRVPGGWHVRVFKVGSVVG